MLRLISASATVYHRISEELNFGGSVMLQNSYLMAPAAQAEAIGSPSHNTNRRALQAELLARLIKAPTWPKSGPRVGLTTREH